jgi:hypothetical protein
MPATSSLSAMESGVAYQKIACSQEHDVYSRNIFTLNATYNLGITRFSVVCAGSFAGGPGLREHVRQ